MAAVGPPAGGDMAGGLVGVDHLAGGYGLGGRVSSTVSRGRVHVGDGALGHSENDQEAQ